MDTEKKAPESLPRMIASIWTDHLSRRRKVQFLWLVVLANIAALSEIFSLGALIPFIALASDPASIENYSLTATIARFYHWDDPAELLLPATILFALTTVITAGVRTFALWATQKYVLRVSHDLSSDVFQLTLAQPYLYHTRKNSGELLAINNKANMMAVSFFRPLLNSFSFFITSISIILFILSISNFIIFYLFFIILFSYYATSKITKKKLKQHAKIKSLEENKKIKSLQEGYGSIKDIILNNTQALYRKNYVRSDLAIKDAETSYFLIATAPSYALQALAIVLVASLVLFLAQGSEGLIASLPLLGTLALGGQRLLPIFQTIYHDLTTLRSARYVVADVLDVLALKLPPDHRSRTTMTFERDLVLSSVNFDYGEDSAPILKDIDLTIRKGRSIGLVGKTGSGKSTLLDSLMGLLEPKTGEIRIDGVTLTAVNRRGWQKHIAHVPQSIYLSDTTIAENIAFGLEVGDIDMARVRQAAQDALIAEDIERLPNGYDTFVGERGIRLSGGQRQRIGLARAFYRRADILMLDEATSALDNETEQGVMDNIRRIEKDITVIMIAHRLSTIKHCDHIIRLAAGEIVAQGTFDEVFAEATHTQDTGSNR